MTVTCKLGKSGCWNDGKCRATSNCENKIVTNADRIRAMTDEELAKVIICPKQVCDKVHILLGRTDCEACALEWLKVIDRSIDRYRKTQAKANREYHVMTRLVERYNELYKRNLLKRAEDGK